jgi:energy-coupling factor transporter ATP-binding protein EcfA2
VPGLRNRIVVVGPSGSGKSRLAEQLADLLGVPHIELDALMHGPNFEPRPTFAADVDRATSAPGWVVDGNYADVRDLVWRRSDMVVWVDLPRLVTEWQVVARTIRRWVRREELWNGNREPGPTGWLDPEHPVRWSWSTHPIHRQDFAARFADPECSGLERVRLRSRAEVRRWLRDVGSHRDERSSLR